MSNLIPEQRPDKNGNLVTRWVRGMFKGKEKTRAIPRVTIDVSPTKKNAYAPLQEERDAYARLRAAIPDDISAGSDLRDNYDILVDAYKDNEHFVFPALEKLGSISSYRRIREAAVHLRNQGVDDQLTETQLRAYNSMRLVIREAVLEAQEKTGLPLPPMYSAVIDLPRYVLLNTEDGPILEEIVKRGVSSKEEIFDSLKSLKEDKVSRPISDGFL